MSESLKQRVDAAKERLRQAQAALQASQARQRHREAKAARALDTRRKVLMGAFVLDRLVEVQQTPAEFSVGGVKFGDWLSRDYDRAAFGLTASEGVSNGQ